jgi:hypothetical protein
MGGSEQTKGRIFDRSNVAESGEFEEFVRIGTVKARRMTGPFTCVTLHGVTTCDDGWLAVDSGGWPYPIAAAEFDRIYKPVDAGVTAS